MNLFEGDPKVFLSIDGADWDVVNGQLKTETGLENHIYYSLFTEAQWFGNSFLNSGLAFNSNLQQAFKGALTSVKLNEIRNACITALSGDAFGNIECEVLNPSSNTININLTVHPPNQDPIQLFLTRHGGNWNSQIKRIN